MYRKRFLSLLAAILLCIGLTTPALAADTEIIVTPLSQTTIGDTVTVNVEIKGNPGISAVQFNLTYDTSVLECIDGNTGSVLQGALKAINPNASSGAIVAAASVAELTQDGILATFTFRVVGKGEPSFKLADVVLCGEFGNQLPYSVTGAEEVKNIPPNQPEQSAPSRPSNQESQVEQPKSEESPVIGEQNHCFTDTVNHWAESYINTAVERGCFQGYSDGSFKPGNQVTRGAYVAVLWRMAGKPEHTVAAPFTDTASLSGEFQKAIAWAYERGLVGGRTPTTFAPGEPVTRQAAMKILYSYAGGVSGQGLMFTQIYDDTFTDSGALAPWAKAPMYWAIYNELISGTSKTTLGATETATRAQLAKILVNYADKLGGQ